MFDIKASYADGTAYVQKRLNDRYFLDYIEGNGTLIITFNAFGTINEKTIRTEEPWGFKFIARHGLSILGIKPLTAEWYRGPDLHAFLRSAEFARFVAGFDRVILYGTSMGAFAALVFSDAVPNADVLALNPQTTLDRRIVPWEWRWKGGQAQDWNGDFNDAAIFSRKARRVFVTYDPFFRLDRLHAERLPKENVTRVLVPLVGHSTTIWLTKMGLLKGLFLDVLNGTFDTHVFRERVRKRRSFAHYYVELARHAATRRPGLRQWSLDRATELGQEDPSVFLDMAVLHMADHKPEAAQEALLRFIDLRPKYPHGYYQMSQILRRQNRFEEAVAFGEMALAISPKNATYQQWMETLADLAKTGPDVSVPAASLA